MGKIISISYNGIPIELAQHKGFLGIEYWVGYEPPTGKRTIYLYLGKVINQYNVYAFIERNNSKVVFKKFDELNSPVFKPFLLNMERINKEVENL